MYILYLTVGIFFLYYGADYLVKGSAAIAISAGVKKIVVGLTLVALGTSMPEFIVSLVSAMEHGDVSIGNIVGSNLANILLILGISSAVRAIEAEKRIFRVELPVLLIITTLFVIFCYDGNLVGYEGLTLLILFVTYMSFIVVTRKDQRADEKDLADIKANDTFKNIVFVVLGLIGLILGGNLTVKGAVDLAHILGISELVIGLTVVALGTSLPELFTSIVAAIKKEYAISIGNAIGSNLFNTAFVLGIVPMINSLRVSPDILKFDNFFMLGVTLLLSVFLFSGKSLSRLEGVFFIFLYMLFILNLVFNFI
jgi:cation:H+ antiporter